MKLLVNDKEIVNYLISLFDFQHLLDDVKMPETHVAEAIGYALVERAKGTEKWRKKKLKIKDKIRTGVERDLREYMLNLKTAYQETRKEKFSLIQKNLDTILERVGKDKIITNFEKSNFNAFVKSTGQRIDPSARIVRRYNFTDVQEDCLLRNTVGNEKFLVSKIDNKLPFWFIDSGYTNFIEPNKKWHRLVRNHLHPGKFFEAPVDRLGIFPRFPRKWRETGHQILVIEPGEFAAAIFHININQWKLQVQEELRKYTDRPIVFREKISKKRRQSLFHHLLDEDYYCVININSNAATEAVWAGIPIITLDQHITNSISKNKISEINNLYRGSLANWLSMLSYSQFTFDELINGHAVNIVKKYHV